MFRIFHKSKSRKHPIIMDEQGRSGKKQAFALFDEGYRPSEIAREKLIPVRERTLFRYFEEWNKRKGFLPNFVLKEYLKDDLELRPRFIDVLARYFNVPEEEIIMRMRKPLDLLSLLSREMPDSRLYKTRRDIEKRLEVAFRMIILAETDYENPPEQINRLILQLLTLPDNNRLIISKIEGRLEIKNEKLRATS